MTRKEAIKELRRLLKPRTYLVKFWGNQCVEIEAAWKSDTSISLERVDYLTVPRNRERGIFTIEEVQSDLTKFQKDVHHLCKMSDRLAKNMGETIYNYFQNLMFEAEK